MRAVAAWVGVVAAVAAARACVAQVLQLSDELVEFDEDGDGVLDVNAIFAKDESLFPNLENVATLYECENVGIRIGYMRDGAGGFEERFGANFDYVFVKKGTRVADLAVLFSGLELNHEEIDDVAIRSAIRDFLLEAMSVDVGFVNFEDETVSVFWNNPATNELHDVGALEPGEPNTEWRESFIGHEFVIIWADGRKRSFVVKTDEIFVLGSFPSAKGSRPEPSQDEFDALEAFERERASRVSRTFTESGYKRVSPPAELLADVRRYWNVNRGASFVEDWGGNGLYVNWWEADALLLPPSPGLKEKWHEMMRPVLEEWSGVALEPTDLYGIRTYQRGARLQNHVDRESTHAVSAILNVEQDPAIEADWELEIVDGAGTLQRVVMAEGDAVLYESARCLHGRPTALRGDYFANLFFHFRPSGESDEWFEEHAEDDDPWDEEDEHEDEELELEYDQVEDEGAEEEEEDGGEQEMHTAHDEL